MIRLLLFVDYLIGLYVFILILTAIMSWLVAFDVINMKNNVIRSVTYALSALTEPVLEPIRRYVPTLGGLDLSFLILILLLQFIRWVLIPDLIDVFQ